MLLFPFVSIPCFVELVRRVFIWLVGELFVELGKWLFVELVGRSFVELVKVVLVESGKGVFVELVELSFVELVKVVLVESGKGVLDKEVFAKLQRIFEGGFPETLQVKIADFWYGFSCFGVGDRLTSGVSKNGTKYKNKFFFDLITSSWFKFSYCTLCQKNLKLRP